MINQFWNCLSFRLVILFYLVECLQLVETMCLVRNSNILVSKLGHATLGLYDDFTITKQILKADFCNKALGWSFSLKWSELIARVGISLVNPL